MGRAKAERKGRQLIRYEDWEDAVAERKLGAIAGSVLTIGSLAIGILAHEHILPQVINATIDSVHFGFTETAAYANALVSASFTLRDFNRYRRLRKVKPINRSIIARSERPKRQPALTRRQRKRMKF